MSEQVEFDVGDYVTFDFDGKALVGFVSLHVNRTYRFETIFGDQLWAHETNLKPATITPIPLRFKNELAYARIAFGQGFIAHSSLKRAAQNYIDAIEAYGRKERKRVSVPSIAKLLR